MKSTRKVHVHLDEVREVPVTGNTSIRFVSKPAFTVLLIIGIALMVATSIVVPIVLVKRFNSRSTSSPLFADTSSTTQSPMILTTTIRPINPTRTTPLSNATSSTTKSMPAITSSSRSTISSTMSTTISTKISSTGTTTINTMENYSADVNNGSSVNMSTIETIIDSTSWETPTEIFTPPPMGIPNLLLNPGGESGNLYGWVQTGSSNVILDSGGILNSGYNPRSGRYCFAGGYGPNSPSALTQNVRLLNGTQGFTERQLDSGMLRAHLSFYYQTWDHLFARNDDVEVILTFRSAISVAMVSESSRKLACKGSTPRWCHFNSAFRLPIGTRSIDYRMTFIQVAVGGSNIDSYIDDNSLTIM